MNFTLRPGERRALIGPNGAGKTTFLNLLTGRLQASSGNILLDGEGTSPIWAKRGASGWASAERSRSHRCSPR